MATNPKRFAAEAALKLVRSGMKLGLGTGSTATFFIEALGQALQRGELRDIIAIPTSVGSELLAKQYHIPLTDFGHIDSLDLTVDGADEVDPNCDVIKGLGGALLREKVVAQNSKRLVIIADASKRVSQLGTKSPLPVEVVPFANDAHERFLRTLGCEPVIRRTSGGMVFVTDNGNHILDCRFKQIDDPAGLDRALQGRAGIVEHGLFIGVPERAIIARDDGTLEEVVRK
ncbi:MAG: ribose-5-phosphate isomerase RpiA [Tepidisphaeraceae bacterium]